MSFTDDFLNGLQKGLQKRKKKQTNTSRVTPVTNDEDIAPVKESTERTWFQSGEFEDGYQFGDVTKTILGTLRDTEENIVAGGLGIVEKTVDATAYALGGIGGLFGADEFKQKAQNLIQKDLIDEEAWADKVYAGVPSMIADLIINGESEETSVFGEKTDSLAQSGGQLLGTVGLQMAGVPWWVTSGVTSFGAEAENALNQDATFEEAGISAGISAGAELLTEKLFGGSGLGETGLINMDFVTKGVSNKIAKVFLDYGIDMAAEGAEEIASGFASALGQQLTYASDKELSELFSSEDAFESFIGGAILSGGINVGKVSNSLKTGKDYRTDLTANEQAVFDAEYNERIKEAEKNGQISKKKKAEIYDSVMQDMENGAISTDTIERVLGGETYTDYKTTIASEESVMKELAELYEGDELQQQVNDILSNSKRTQIKDRLSREVFDMVKGDRLFESYNQKAQRGKAFTADVSQYDTKQQAIVQKAIDSGILNNTRRTHIFVDTLAKMSADTGVLFDFTNNARLRESGFAIEGRTINGLVDDAGNISINIDSPKAWQTTVGHEITHVLEGTDLYNTLQETLFEYAKSRKSSSKQFDNEYKERLYTTRQLYKGVKGYEGVDGFNKIKKEVVADLVGDYLFTDSDFINHLSTKNRNIFEKIYDEIKHMLKLVTAGSEEARQLERVKKAFEDAYRAGGKKTTGKTTYSLTPVDPVQPTSDKWNVGASTDEVRSAHPTLYAVDEDATETRNPTQVKNTVSSYRKVYNFLQNDGFDGAILDASSGLGLGTQAGIEEYGFDVDDIEPYPDKDYNPKYTDYSTLDKKYDAIISNAVLNVLPQDQRDALVVKMGELLNPGGRMFINVRGKDVLNSSGKIAINESGMEYFIPRTAKTGSYQKGFTPSELKAYLEDALGDGFEVVDGRKVFGSSTPSAIVTKKGDVQYSISPETDNAYMDAVNRGDTETAQKMVDEVAKKAGYEHRMFHETDATNIHVFDITRGDHGATDYETPYGIFTKTSNKSIGLGSNQMTLLVKAQNTLYVENRDDVRNKIPGFAQYYDQIQEIDRKYDALAEQLEDEEFDALAEWIEEHPDADMDVLLPNSYIIEGKPADIDSERYLEAHRKYQEIREEWSKAYDSVAVKAKGFITSYLRNNGYDSMYFKVDGGSRGRQTDSLIVLDPNQVKSANPITYDDSGNVIPLSERFNRSDPDIRYSLGEVTDAQNEHGLDRKQEVQFSISRDGEFSENAIALNNTTKNVDPVVLNAARAIRDEVAKRLTTMKENGVALPPDIEGDTWFDDKSYGGTMENTLVCPRSLAPEAFMDAVSETIGRPLDYNEQIYVGQELMTLMTTREDLRSQSFMAQCVYCYVAADRMAQRVYLGRYIEQRDAVLAKISPDMDISTLEADHNALSQWWANKKGMKKPELSEIGKLYQEYLAKRKPTGATYERFKMWVEAYINGSPMIDGHHLASIEKLTGDLNEFGAELIPQIEDAWKYAQSASWAKKRTSYVAYNGQILEWDDDLIKALNEHYGMRMYSFSDYHPAFVLENMQMITDAAVRGLKVLAYTKDLDFVEIFAPSHANINISTFGFEKDGSVYEDHMMGADWAKAQALRAKYPNVGITFVATNDTMVEWALQQDWIDVVIPFHLVKTGQVIADHYGYHDYTRESSDKKKPVWRKDKTWKESHDGSISPVKHGNDLDTYFAQLAENELTPRFKRFYDNPKTRPYYMKLVNECRLSASEVKPVQPNFDQEAIARTLARLETEGYYTPIGGSVERMYEIAAEVAENMIAPVNSLSAEGEQFVPTGNFYTPANELRYEGIAPATEATTPVTEATENNVQNVAENSVAEFPDDLAPMADDDEAQDIFDAPFVETAKPVTGAYEAITPKKQPRMARVEQQKVAEVLDAEPETAQKKRSVFTKAMANFADKGFVFENLALKTKNRNLMGKWNHTLSSESRAQWLIGKGTDTVMALNDIREEVESTGDVKGFYEYLYHKHNMDRMTLAERFENTPNKPVFGDSVTAEMSRKIVERYEAESPAFKDYAQDVYNYMDHLRQLMVDNGVISQKTARLWARMYPHYVPIRRVGDAGLNINVPLDTGRTGVNAPVKRATGGNRDILPLFDTMAMRTEQTYKAIARNSFGVELKNTLGTAIESEASTLDEVIDSIDTHEGLLQEGKNGRSPTFTVFENGEKVTFEITEDMYDALKPTSEGLAYTNKVLNTASNVHRGLLTEYNPVFMVNNAIKDAQDILINSQHPVKTYRKIPQAIKELASKGNWYMEYMENGGEQNTYFDKQTNTFVKEKSGIAKLIGIPLDKISEANNFIERIPRLAEYIASREDGASVEVAMLDAARVTTNFAAGGDVTKFLNRNGATFLNASVQGAMQQVRNVREAKANGLKGWVQLATKFAVAGLPAMLLNHLLWDDDEEYEELSDYVKQNYYVVAKFDDGKFVRIPKGRTLAVIQNAFEQMDNLITGDDEVDFGSFAELAISNLAPNNPIDNNILSPIVQVANNTTWYGEDLVPTRLQDLPAAEQYDESTDAISKWLGEKLNYSPVKINYLLNQYSGGVGDVVLPMLTPEAESGDNSFLGNVLAPFKDKFTTDSVMNNQNISDFYDTVDELTTNAKSSKATDEDVLKYKYINSVNADLSELYALKREVQNSDLPDESKYAKVREIQEQIVAIAKEGLSAYNTVSISGEYATVGDRHYRLNKNGEWQKVTDDQLEKQEDVTSELGISGSDYWSNKDEYDFAYKYPEKYTVAKVVGGYEAYKTYSSELYDIKADKDENGKTISGSRKEKVIDYINNMDADYGEKIILFKSEYPADDTYNYDIIDYLNSRNDLSYSEIETILKELDFEVDSEGNIYW